MNISEGARRLLTEAIEGELETEGSTLSLSERKGNVCLTRVFRFGGAADEWVRRANEECRAADGGEISIREMWVPGQDGETTLVVVLSAGGIVLGNEPERRVAYTPGGVRIAEVPGSETSVQVRCERDSLGYIEGSIQYNGKTWNARIEGRSPGALANERDLMGHRVFGNLQDVLGAIDQVVEDREGRETERRAEGRRTAERARAQIDGLFAAGLTERG